MNGYDNMKNSNTKGLEIFWWLGPWTSAPGSITAESLRVVFLIFRILSLTSIISLSFFSKILSNLYTKLRTPGSRVSCCSNWASQVPLPSIIFKDSTDFMTSPRCSFCIFKLEKHDKNHCLISAGLRPALYQHHLGTC